MMKEKLKSLILKDWKNDAYFDDLLMKIENKSK